MAFLHLVKAYQSVVAARNHSQASIIGFQRIGSIHSAQLGGPTQLRFCPTPLMLPVTPDKSLGTGLGILILAFRAGVGRLGLWPNARKHLRMSIVGLGLPGLGMKVPMVMVMMLMVLVVVFFCPEHESVVVDVVVLVHVVVYLCAPFGKGNPTLSIFLGIRVAMHGFHMTGL